ncbi:MAG: HlyD family efflux transporter periplasmic adaptor subunit [Colwellia sp.]|uniref:HlyD family secretion protein n=1 Tax=Colwellia sp. TaxID=56799 RepID=UPI0025B8F4DF|nr:HlyD family efflux transporter periplasmic adaptor subunit [Colwellia sp.]NQZ25762.1 HlyD family efflux transporter periplasmic adaptor subunit [Colwellia sp.]
MENLFRQEVIENKNHRLEGKISLVQPPIFKSLTLLLLIIVVISLVFLSYGSYSRKERVSGVLQPDLGLVKLMAPQSGVLVELFVSEGQSVKQGQSILRIKTEKYGVGGVEINQSLINQYQFQLKNLQHLYQQQFLQNELQNKELQTNRVSLLKRLKQLMLQNELFNKRIAINKSIVEQISSLASTGYISEIELKRQDDTLLSLKQQSSAIESESLLLNNQLEMIDNQLIQLPIEQGKTTSELSRQIENIKVQLSSVKQQQLGELKAPIDGVITGLLIKKGRNVSLGQNILTILPKGSELQGIIYVPTSAFGFIEEGQATTIRYHAFPYEKFGLYDGRVAEISATVILPTETETPNIISQPSYRVVIALGTDKVNAYGKEIPLKSGMMLEADIVIEERSLIRWLFDPVFSIGGRL